MFICEQNKGDDDVDKNPTIKIDRGFVNDNIKPETKDVKAQDDKKGPKQYKIK